MKLHIKHMVCNRCIMAVKTILDEHHLKPKTLELGEVEIEENLEEQQLLSLDDSLKKIGFELIDDRKSRTIEKIKTIIINQIHHSDTHASTTLSKLISDHLNTDYNHLSNIFSEAEGITIEKYFINQRVEKAKELIVYDELSLSQIADKLGYSNVAHLSNQFKKITGLTPSFYKSLKKRKRTNIDDL
ncbi:AraC-like DNA-binding protein [Pedobacter sp. UYEF25]